MLSSGLLAFEWILNKASSSHFRNIIYLVTSAPSRTYKTETKYDGTNDDLASAVFCL